MKGKRVNKRDGNKEERAREKERADQQMRHPDSADCTGEEGRGEDDDDGDEEGGGPG